MQATNSELLQGDSLEKLLFGIDQIVDSKSWDWMTGKDFKAMCRMYNLERTGFCDYVEHTRVALQVLSKHQKALETIVPYIKSTLKYMGNCLKKKPDPNSWHLIASSTTSDLNMVIEIIETINDNDALVLVAYKLLLVRIEEGWHKVSYIIQQVGNRFLAEAEDIIATLSYEMAQFFLHGYNFFKKDAAVMGFLEKAQGNRDVNQLVQTIIEENLKRFKIERLKYL